MWWTWKCNTQVPTEKGRVSAPKRAVSSFRLASAIEGDLPKNTPFTGQPEQMANNRARKVCPFQFSGTSVMHNIYSRVPHGVCQGFTGPALRFHSSLCPSTLHSSPLHRSFSLLVFFLCIPNCPEPQPMTSGLKQSCLTPQPS